MDVSRFDRNYLFSKHFRSSCRRVLLEKSKQLGRSRFDFRQRGNPARISDFGKNQPRIIETNRTVLFGNRRLRLLGFGNGHRFASETERRNMKTFWFALTILALIWYIVVTIYVGFKGVADIKKMLKRLSEQKIEND